MINKLQKIGIVGVILTSGMSVPFIPQEMDYLKFSYQYKASEYQSVIDTAILQPYENPQPPFPDEDGNDLISVGVFADKKGNTSYVQMDDSRYSDMAKRGGVAHNPTKSEFVSLLDTIIYPPTVDAVAFNATSSVFTGSATSWTITHTAGGTDRIAIMSAVTSSAGDANNLPTVDGNNAVLIRKYNYTGGQWMYMWYYIAPPASSVNYVLTSTGTTDNDFQLETLSGAKQSSQPDSDAEGDSASDGVTLTTTVVASDSWLISSARNYANGISVQVAGTGTTERIRKTYHLTGDSNAVVGTGSQSMTWDSTSGSGATAGIIASIAPSAVSTPSGWEDSIIISKK